MKKTKILLIVVAILLITVPVYANGNDDVVNYGFISLMPAIIAIGLAFVTKQVVLSLFIGSFFGSIILNGGNVFYGFIRLADTYILGQVQDGWNASLILFILGTGGFLAVMGKMGGTHAIAEFMARKVKTAKSAQLAAWMLGLVIFFEDMANVLIVGPTMRPLTDKMKVSREKLAYIVDSTSAPVVDIAIISSWIAYEVSVIKMSFDSLNIDVNSFELYVRSIPFRFYNILSIIMVLVIILLAKDFGPMLKAERRARMTGKVLKDGSVPMISEAISDCQPKEGIKIKISNALIPILTMIVSIIFELWYTGGGVSQPFTVQGLQEAFGNADAGVAVWIAILFTSIVTIIMAVVQKIMETEEAITTWVDGAKGMLITAVILVLAWTTGGIMKELGTASYLVSIIGNSVPVFIMPGLLFIIACLVSFSTGTSFGTSGIMLPLAIPMAVAASGGEVSNLAIICIGAVTSGAIFGDHCSPISDTTIMSSMGCGADHMDHVKTQLPYAITVAAVSLIIGLVPAALGLSPVISIALAAVTLWMIVKFYGKDSEKVYTNKELITNNNK